MPLPVTSNIALHFTINLNLQKLDIQKTTFTPLQIH